MRVSLIWAMAENGVIGRAGGLPWRLPDDLRHFQRLTRGHPVLMGRRTWDSIGAKPLPDRRCIVVTRNPTLTTDGAIVVHDFAAGLEAAEPADELFVVGGADIYTLALPRADRLWVTVVHAQVEGDVVFPEVDWREWRPVSDERHPADGRHAQSFSIRRYERV